MADIALLVAEDFEKSSKARWEKAGHGVRPSEEGFHFLASFTVSALGRKAGEEVSSLKEVGRAPEPRSSFGSAASDGLFSA